MDNGNLQYVNGQVEYFDQCDVDCMSIIEHEDFAKRLRYEEYVTFHDRVSAANVHVLEDDMHVMVIISMVGRDRVVEIFMVVPIKPLAVDYSGVAINISDSS